MENDIAIRVKNLTKIFKIYYTPADFAKELIFRTPYHKEAKALDNISFEVKKGEVVGFIGRNGAGKSTLLKILTGTLDKTSGEIEMEGKISSILELGTGFHPEYTGRENIFMGGLCLGMSKEEIRAKEQSIIEFSELADFIDQPFKTYSSGMKARLTFATAVAVDPEILIVDEALSVGDARFSRKCYDRITKLRESGKTILMVSHDQNSITTFCDKAILLEQGCIVETGDPSYVTKIYFDRLFGKMGKDNSQEAAEMPLDKGKIFQLACEKYKSSSDIPEKQNANEVRCGDRKEAEILDYGILNENGEKVHLLSPHEKYLFYVKGIFYSHVENPNFGFIVRNVKGIDIFGLCSRAQCIPVKPTVPGDVIEFKTEVSIHLVNGEFFLGVGISEGERVFDFRYDAFTFSMLRNGLLLDSSIVDFEHKADYTVLGNITAGL